MCGGNYMIKLDVHTHSIASGHGTIDTIADMAKHAATIGLSILGITDHGPATMGSGRPSYFRNLSYSPKKRCGIDLLYGVELNILDAVGTLDLDNDILLGLDFAIASMHTQNKKPGSIIENTESYIKAMENPYVKIIGHCDDTNYPVDYEALIKAAKANHVLIELNNNSLSPDGYRGNTLPNDLAILKYCQRYRHPLLLSSDSHGRLHIGDVAYADALAKRVGFPDELILNNNPEYFLDFIKR